MFGNVRITKKISFADLKQGKVSYFDVYESQVNSWIFEPAECLAKLRSNGDTDKGMAILALLLMFFEPHGQYLTGNDKGGSKQKFVFAFERFVQFLIKKKRVKEDIQELKADSFYKFARCGLFHSLKLSNELLINVFDIGGTSILKNPLFSEGWIVSPWILLDDMKAYLEHYVKELKQPASTTLIENFNKTFNRLLIEPMEYFFERESKL